MNKPPEYIIREETYGDWQVLLNEWGKTHEIEIISTVICDTPIESPCKLLLILTKEPKKHLQVVN